MLRLKNPRARIACDRLSDIREVVKTRQAKMRRQDLEKRAVRVFFRIIFHDLCGTLLSWNLEQANININCLRSK